MLHIIAWYVIKGALRWYTDGETDDEVTGHDVHETSTVDDKVRRDKADHKVFICLHRSGAGHTYFFTSTN